MRYACCQGFAGVNNQVILEPPSVRVAEVTKQIQAALSRSAALHAQEIKVEAKDRRITLRGTVHSWMSGGRRSMRPGPRRASRQSRTNSPSPSE
jgi:hypothetical protein